jgi:biopolymer transport protein ExbD
MAVRRIHVVMLALMAIFSASMTFLAFSPSLAVVPPPYKTEQEGEIPAVIIEYRPSINGFLS